MKVLLIYPGLTHPIDAGNKYWAVSQADELRRLGHDVSMLCINVPGLKSDSGANMREIDMTRQYWGNRCHIFNAPIWLRVRYACIMNYRRIFCNGYYKCDDLFPVGLTQYVRRLQKKYGYDACIVNYYWLTKVFEGVRFRHMAVNTHDVFANRDIITESRNPWMCTTAAEEAKGLGRAQTIFALQDEESIYFKRIAPESHVSVVYCPYKTDMIPVTHNHNIVMLSSANDFNVKGFRWFCEKVYPSIVREFPDVNLVVAGNICSKFTEYAGKEHFTFLGRVDDAKDLYKRGDVAINPCPGGTGLKIKTFEALSYGRVAMVHPHSTKGIYRSDSSPVFSSDNPEDWVDFLKTVWSDETLLSKIMNGSIAYIEAMNEHIGNEYRRFLSADGQ